MDNTQLGSTVTVVIPTRNRPRMVVAAVESAFQQTCPPLEVIVVVDGPEETASTVDALHGIKDPRLRVLELPESVGGGEARNYGVRAGTGDWIAFLDDDDLWLPGKLGAQLALAESLEGHSIPVLSCPVLARAPGWEEVWPRKPYTPGEPMAEYLFCRKGWRYGAALLQTSTLLAPRSLLLRIPFTVGLRKHQDWDWLLRAAAEPGVRVYPAGSEPLAIFHVEGERASVGRARNWRFSLQWARNSRALFSPRAFSGFITTECAAQASGETLRERVALACIAAREGMLSGQDWLRLLGFLFIPQSGRRGLRRLLRSVGHFSASAQTRISRHGERA